MQETELGFIALLIVSIIAGFIVLRGEKWQMEKN